MQAEAGAADILPDDILQWMWGDAGGLGHAIAQKDPLRWSPRRDLEETIIDLGNRKDEKRPVEIRTERTSAILQFDTVEKALLALFPVLNQATAGEKGEQSSADADADDDCQAGYVVGQRVERRKSDCAWACGYVTQLDPLKVTIKDKKGGLAITWDEVRPIKGLILPDDKIKWMWADAKMIGHRLRQLIPMIKMGRQLEEQLSHTVASMNRFRWSLGSPSETIAELETVEEKHRNRPVSVIVKRDGKNVWDFEFKTVVDATAALTVQAEYAKTLRQAAASSKSFPMVSSDEGEIKAESLVLKGKQRLGKWHSADSIVAAWYGQSGEEWNKNGMDVTAKVKDLVRSDEDVRPHYEDLGIPDPCPGVDKTLFVFVQAASTFEKHESVEVWSVSGGAWRNAIVLDILPTDTTVKRDGRSSLNLTAGTTEVNYVGTSQNKYIPRELQSMIRKAHGLRPGARVRVDGTKQGWLLGRQPDSQTWCVLLDDGQELRANAESLIEEATHGVEAEEGQIHTLLKLLCRVNTMGQLEDQEATNLIKKQAQLRAKQDECARLKEQLQQKENDAELIAKLAAAEAELARLMKARPFGVGEDVFAWSDSREKWMPAVVTKVFDADSKHKDQDVKAGAILVQYGDQEKFEKLIPCALVSDRVCKDKPLEGAQPSAMDMTTPKVPERLPPSETPAASAALASASLSRLPTADAAVEPAAASIHPYDTVTWMWRDAGLSGALTGHAFFSRANPFRWSDWKQLGATIKELGAAKEEGKNRPVRMRTKKSTVLLDFETVDEALEALKAQAQEEEVSSWFSKLYCFVGDAWEEKGTGAAKLLKHNQSGQVRFMFEQEKTAETLSNHLVVESDGFCNFLHNDNGDTCRVWTAQEYVEDEGTHKIQTVALKFCTVEHANDFETLFKDARRKPVPVPIPGP